MSDKRYTLFHDKCNELEARFGNQGNLRLKGLDMSAVKCERLLDFGAGKGLNAGLCEEYYRLDTDADLNPDFTNLNQLTSDDMFDGIIANQVFEHIERDELFPTVDALAQHMVPGARILATVPNPHRGSYFFNDFDHKTPLMFYHIGAFFELAGLKVIDCYRYTKRPAEIDGANENVQALFEIMKKYYELDPAQFLAVLAEK